MNTAASRELLVCGLASVKARFERDPTSIRRLFFDEVTARKLGPLCRELAAARKVYRCVPTDELEKIAGSVHHGGVVAVVMAPILRAPSLAEVRGWATARLPLLLLDRIGNAHNLGAIARTAAFFGVEHLIIPNHPGAARPGDSAHRVAEGGLELVQVWQVDDLTGLVRALRAAGYDVIGAVTRGGQLGLNPRNHPTTTPSAHTPRRPPVAVVVGNEEHGLAPELAGACSQRVTIPGSGKVESLNVSVATAVLLWELLARHRTEEPEHRHD